LRLRLYEKGGPLYLLDFEVLTNETALPSNFQDSP
jgi:hypothetical protein